MTLTRSVWAALALLVTLLCGGPARAAEDPAGRPRVATRTAHAGEPPARRHADQSGTTAVTSISILARASTSAIGALSPTRKPIFRMRV